MANKKVCGEITALNKLTNDIFDMTFKFPDSYSAAKEAIPGQFASLYLNDETKLLPRPISICEVLGESNSLRFVFRVVGEGTKLLSEMKVGDCFYVLAPLGNGYKDIRKGVNVLLGGGVGIPPMLELAKKINDPENTYVYLGFRSDETFLYDDFTKYANVILASDDGSIGYHGNVLQALKRDVSEKGLEPDTLYACGPIPMLKGIKEFAHEKNIKAYVSMEERMACGIGACLGCVCKTTEKDHHSHVNNTRVCADGPVFDADYIDI
ncbi:MAG: dihydroorotate dehydrogenase electron transfer subunit [Lachnospiraceae bacterium]|nr:dihydroorotate dehydrogenase electron transfer subunit [Lachnospiraceae bacterium]